MDQKTNEIYEAVCTAIDALQSVSIGYMKTDIPNDILDYFKAMMYAGRPEVEIRYEIPQENKTSMYLIWDEYE